MDGSSEIPKPKISPFKKAGVAAALAAASIGGTVGLPKAYEKIGEMAQNFAAGEEGRMVDGRLRQANLGNVHTSQGSIEGPKIRTSLDIKPGGKNLIPYEKFIEQGFDPNNLNVIEVWGPTYEGMDQRGMTIKTEGGRGYGKWIAVVVEDKSGKYEVGGKKYRALYYIGENFVTFNDRDKDQKEVSYK